MVHKYLQELRSKTRFNPEPHRMLQLIENYVWTP